MWESIKCSLILFVDVELFTSSGIFTLTSQKRSNYWSLIVQSDDRVKILT